MKWSNRLVALILVCSSPGALACGDRPVEDDFRLGVNPLRWYPVVTLSPSADNGTRYLPQLIRQLPGEVRLLAGGGYGAILESRCDYGHGRYEFSYRAADTGHLPPGQGLVGSVHSYRVWDGRNKAGRAEIDFETLTEKNGARIPDYLHLAVHGERSVERLFPADCISRWCDLRYDWHPDRVDFYIDGALVLRVMDPPKPPAAVRLMAWSGAPRFGGRHPPRPVHVASVRSFRFTPF